MRLFEKAEAFVANPAIRRPRAYSYGDLLRESHHVATSLLAAREDLHEEPVAFIAKPGPDYVVMQWGIWRAGGVAVPLPRSHSKRELREIVETAKCRAVIGDEERRSDLVTICRSLGISYTALEQHHSTPGRRLPTVDSHRAALILFTSGTTAKPKGVLLAHRNLESQAETLSEAWDWSTKDRILNVLPLHHVHGIVNVAYCAFWNGALCDFMNKFDAASVWERFSSSDLTTFMAVPTIYEKLIDYWDALPLKRRRLYSDACRRLRLMVSGSAALRVSTLRRWEAITGHILLERYGMTEIGMALSNPLKGERRPGHVGQPLPGVEVRVVDENLKPVKGGDAGELLVRGPSVFMGYSGDEVATRDAFVDGWFRTGDLVLLEDGYYRILGRMSQDIMKVGGHKISALEIEEVFLQHPNISQCAVVGLDDSRWGEVPAMAVVPRLRGSELSTSELEAWAQNHLAAHKIPRLITIVDELPRNAMGKIEKSKVRLLLRSA